jgi:putative copper resistance protein D
MTAQFLIAVLNGWIDFTALAALVGGLVLEVIILPPEPSRGGAARRRLRGLEATCLVVLVLTTGIELLVRARTMAGDGLAAAISAVPLVLTRTHFGAIWMGRFAVLALALALAGLGSRAARAGSLTLAVAVTLTTSLTGHAADRGDLTPGVAIDWIHVMTVSAWAGGLLCLALCVLGPARAWPGALLGQVARRFSRLAGLCLLAVVVTGSYNAWTELREVSDLWTTAYGRLLATKLLLFLGLAWWGAVNRYTVVSRLGGGRAAGPGERLFRLGRLALRGPARGPRPGPSARLRTYVVREAVLVLLVLACTAALVDSTPARHAGQEEHRMTEERGPFRVTMEQLHESGGVPPGWVFVPPAGDATRGREVFLRLGCPGCHGVTGETLTSPSRPGPDLAGVGHHHPPGYLLESILNPDAVIVLGPGHTRPDGTSIMPDLRAQLSASDLVDLVAYLETL